ncbi:MAG: tetratricopeptide repeat protein [Nannocystaceae bacterium]|nr:tetratricopeptide repeat protein [Nannocystaceae bacterium]
MAAVLRLTVALLLGAGCAHDHAQLGRDALARGDDREAARQFEAALQRDDDASLWRDLARARQRQGDIDGAHDAIVEAAERAPEDPSIVLVRAQLRFAREDREGAARDAAWLLPRLRGGGELERLAVLLVRLGDAPAALRAAARAVEVTGGTAGSYVNLAVLATELRRTAAARDALAEGRKRHPRDLALLETEAAFLLSQGQLDGARADYAAMLDRHAHPGLVHLALALIDHERGALDDAKTHAAAAVEAEGHVRADVHYTLVVVLRDRGELDEARTRLRKARRRFPADDGLARLEAELATR